MKKLLLVALMILFGMALAAPVTAAPPDPGPTPTTSITLVGLSTGDTIELAVGESYTFVVKITSDVSFIRAQAALDQFYPGRSVFAGGVVGAGAGNSATLEITVTGKTSTADLPGGVAPVAVAVAVRYGGGVVVPQYFDLNIVVH